MSKPIDPVDIKKAIQEGQLEVLFGVNDDIYIRDTVTSDCVKIWEDSDKCTE